MAEVEKIWVIYDLDDNSLLGFEEAEKYLLERAFPHLQLSESDIVALWEKIDADGSGYVNKEEMNNFVHLLLKMNRGIQIKQNEEKQRKAR